MQSFRFGLTSFMIGGAVFALAAFVVPARAELFDQECKASCKDAVKTCVGSAKAAYRSCKEDCQGDDDRRSCKRECRPAIRIAKEVCRSAREGCKASCEHEPPPPEECGHCRAELRVCLHDVAQDGRACTSECIGSKLDAARQCRSAPNPIRCIILLARETATCLRGCSHGIQIGARGCQMGHAQCRIACEDDPAPYGSASQAFLLPSPNLFQ